jgi:hypothetical protein
MRKSVAKVPHRSSHSRNNTKAITPGRGRERTISVEQPKNAPNNHRSPIRTKTASEQSSPNSEKNPRKLRDLMKRNAEFMAKASKASDDSAIV